MNPLVGTIVVPPNLQTSVDRFTRALQTSHKLLNLHPRKQGNPGNAAALSPAVVLSSISAFEGFAEDFTAQMMANEGSSFAEIAKKVGAWNNPSLSDFANHMKKYFTLSEPAIDAGAIIEVFDFPYVKASTAVRKEQSWNEALTDSQSWMQVRHLLSHGLTTGWRAEWWPGPLRQNDPPASLVLRDMGGGRHSLVLHGAISCARIDAIGAKTIANAVANAYGHTLDWKALPDFN